MLWRDRLVPRRMARVAVVASESHWRHVVTTVADSGLLEPDAPGARPEVPSVQGAEPSTTTNVGPRLAHEPVSDHDLTNDPKLAAGEVELARVSAATQTRHGVTAMLGWMDSASKATLTERLQPWGGSVVELPYPPGVEPPTLLDSSHSSAVRPLVDTYATVPYRDLDPTWFAVAAYVVMFGMMFGDVGHGLLLFAGALWARRTQRPWASAAGRVWPIIAAMGISASIFGLLYGEFFGPTGIVPALWLEPLEEPIRLMIAAIAIGAVLLTISYLIGIVNRWREGGPGFALYAPSGIAGMLMLLGLVLITGGLLLDFTAMWVLGAVGALVGVVLVAVGRRAVAESGPTGVMEASVETFDTVIQLGSNILSFARLAAFGLMHAALGAVVWQATTALWGPGLGAVLAIVVFVVGNVLSFGLEALVAGVQALRLEYYELFSRVFVSEGHPFRPWHIPFAAQEGA